MPQPSDTRNGRLSREERRTAFLDAAAGIVVEQGAEMLTMEGLAAAAGVNKALAYRHFDNRDDVLLALWTREMDRLIADIDQRSGSDADLESEITALFGAWLDALERPSVVLPRLAQVRTASGELERRRDERRRQIVARVAKLLQTEKGLGPHDALIAASMTITSALAIAEVRRQTGWPRDEVTDTFVRLILGGVDGLRRG